MNDAGLHRLLAEAVLASEQHAPSPDPVAALAGTRRRAARRRGHVAVLAFVLSGFALQALPSEAFGSSPRPAVLAVTAQAAASSSDVARG